MHLTNYISFLARLVNLALIGLLILLAIGIVYHTVELFRLENAGIHAEWSSLLILFLGATEVYLILIFLWFRFIRNKTMNLVLKLLQLIIIFMIGILPGCVALYPAFFKE